MLQRLSYDVYTLADMYLSRPRTMEYNTEIERKRTGRITVLGNDTFIS